RGRDDRDGPARAAQAADRRRADDRARRDHRGADCRAAARYQARYPWLDHPHQPQPRPSRRPLRPCCRHVRRRDRRGGPGRRRLRAPTASLHRGAAGLRDRSLAHRRQERTAAADPGSAARSRGPTPGLRLCAPVPAAPRPLRRRPGAQVPRRRPQCRLLARMTERALLQMEAVVVRYGRLTAVDRLSLVVGEGETLGLVGESGCGKTSLAKALVGLKPISQGRILLAGTDTSAGPATKRGWLSQRIQLLFQDPVASLSPRLTVRRLLQEPLRIRRALTPPAWEEVRRLMAELGLGEN